jgi:uncharacterized protein (DUF2236 family)
MIAPPRIEGVSTPDDSTSAAAIPALDPLDPPVVWRINSETVTLLGWAPAVLMQLAHPLVAAGVSAHSIAISHPELAFHRLNQTIRAMLALTFGDEAERQRAADGINRIHDRVNGALPEAVGAYPAGTRYSAHDPALLAWVHVTLIATLPRTYELYIGPLTPEERDRYCAEATWLGPLLGIPDDLLPRTAAEVDRYIAEQLASGAITVGPLARELARALVSPAVPRWARLVSPLTALPTIGLLPPAIRAAYGFRWTARHEWALRMGAALARRILPRLPALLHHWPAARAAYRALALH